MEPQLVNGWLVVDHPGGDETSVCWIGVSDREEPTDWKPAFLDWQDGRRVAKVRPPELSSRSLVWLKIGERARSLGRVDS